MIGQTLGAYAVLAKLGEGGMGEVYRARDSKLARDVALKVLPETFAADPERVARFQREAQLLAALSHSNIAGIYGLEDSGPVTVLVMELVEGESLDARLKNGPLPLDEAIAIAKQIGEALGAAHERGIIHRDLKPANIMLTPDGRVKVLDFGLAKMMEVEPAAAGLTMSPTLSIQATLAGTILGTAPYMSPEQARGRAVDKRTDVWAFGCVLFEMLTGKRAFDGEDITGTVANILKDEPDWAALPAGVPASVISALRGCLTKDPRLRFSDIAVPLYVLTADNVVSTAPAAGTRAVPRWKRVLPIAAGIVATALVVEAANWFARPVPVTPAVTRFTIPLPSGEQLSNTSRKTLALSSDGSKLVYVANQRLYLRTMAEPEAHVIPGTEGLGSLLAPDFSPDGLEIAFVVAEERTLKRISVAGGTPVTISPAAQLTVAIHWEQQGILYADPGKGIFRVSPGGGVPQLVIPSAADEIASSPESLPDGRGILYSLRKPTASWDTGNVMVQTAAGERKVLVSGASDGRYDGNGHLLYATSGVVMAIPFDLDRLATFGGPQPAIQGVMRLLQGTNSGMAQYALARNGTLVYVPGPATIGSNDNRVLAIFDGKGGMERLAVPPGTYAAPRVSPDGRMIAFESGGDDTNVWIQDIALKTASRRLTFGGHSRAPVWSPDNQWIAFESDREGAPAIYRQRADGTGVAERLTKPDAEVRYTPQSWSPDGESLLLTADKKGTFELHVLSMKARTTTPYSGVQSAVPTESSFSPDGRWVVYQRGESKEDVTQIQSFVEPFPSTGAKYLVPLRLAGHPHWSRKGDRLLFNTGPTSSTAVEVQTTPTVSFSAPQPYSRVGRSEPNPATDRRAVDDLPDGRIIGSTTDLGGTGGGQTSQRFEIILNWMSELSSRMSH